MLITLVYISMILLILERRFPVSPFKPTNKPYPKARQFQNTAKCDQSRPSVLWPCDRAATQAKCGQDSTQNEDLLGQFILDLVSTPIQSLKHLIRIIFLGNGLQPREALSLAVQTQRLLPSSRIVEKDEGVVKTRCFSFGVDCCGEVLQEGVDIGVVTGVGVVRSEEHRYKISVSQPVKFFLHKIAEIA